MLSSDLIEDIAATAEVCGGSKWSPAAVRIACQHLERFSETEIALPLLAASKRSKGTLRLPISWPGCRTVAQRLTWPGRRYRGPRLRLCDHG